jgi:hypothetical protein
MRFAQDAILKEIAGVHVPPSKRLRRLMREQAETESVREKAAQEQRDRNESLLSRQATIAAFKKTLDNQVAEQRLKKISEAQEHQKQRLETDSLVLEHIRTTERQKQQQREHLIAQKETNERLLEEYREHANAERRRRLAEENEELKSIRQSEENERILRAERKQCRANMLTRNMTEAVEAERRNQQRRRDEQQSANMMQQLMIEMLDEQDRQRKEFRERVAAKVAAGERRAKRQYECLDGNASVEEKRRQWIERKLEADDAALRQQSKAIEDERKRRKLVQVLDNRESLRRQINLKNAARQADIQRDAEWAEEMAFHFQNQSQVDEIKAQYAAAERSDWLQLLDAQKTMRAFNEARDLETSIARRRDDRTNFGSPNHGFFL